MITQTMNRLLPLLLLPIFLGGITSMAFEEPKYTVIAKLEKIELRRYSEFLVAETVVHGKREDAGSLGFKILASYIFGNNVGDNNIAMTAPVVQTETPSSVTATDSSQGWAIQFMMPSKYSLATLPKPKDTKIQFKQIAPKKLAAITYSGRWTDSNYQEHLNILMKEMASAKLKPVGIPLWARYNSPFTPWFLRKNEILVEFE